MSLLDERHRFYHLSSHTAIDSLIFQKHRNTSLSKMLIKLIVAVCKLAVVNDQEGKTEFISLMLDNTCSPCCTYILTGDQLLVINQYRIHDVSNVDIYSE